MKGLQKTSRILPTSPLVIKVCTIVVREVDVFSKAAGCRRRMLQIGNHLSCVLEPQNLLEERERKGVSRVLMTNGNHLNFTFASSMGEVLSNCTVVCLMIIPFRFLLLYKRNRFNMK